MRAQGGFSTGETLRLALWLGLLAGYLELAVVGARLLVEGRLLFISPDTIWVAPLTDALVLLGVALALLAAARRWPGRLTPRAVLGLFMFFGLLAPLLVYNPLYGGTALLLAAGIAVQGSRWVAGRSAGLLRLTRWSVWVLLLLALGSAAAMHGRRAWLERRVLHGLPPAHAGAPSVLLIILDTVRALDLSLYGYQRQTTPEIDRWAAQGVSFDRAVSPAPWTLPSHASIFTGRWAHELAADWMVPLEPGPLTLAEALGRQGYATAGFVANTKYCSRVTGLARGFAHYEDYDLSLGQLAKSSSYGRALTGNDQIRRRLGYYELPGRKTADEINRALLDWLRQAPARPFFAFLNFYDAHDPYLPPAPFKDRFGPPASRTMESILADGKDRWLPEEIRGERDAYDGAIAYLDDRIGKLLAALQREGRLQNTIVVITSDHGEEFGEHGIMRHGHSLFRPAVHVPLVVIYPGKIPAARHVSAVVSLRDLAATVTDLAGLDSAVRFPGRSLARYWSGDSVGEAQTVAASVRYAERQKKSYPVSRGDMYSIIHQGFRLIRNGDGRDELYDFDRDSSEIRDLAADPVAQAPLRALQTALDALVAARDLAASPKPGAGQREGAP